MWVRILATIGCFGFAGCELVFPRQVPVDAPDAPLVDAPPDGPIPVGCSPMSMLADSFDGPLSPGLWMSTGASTNAGLLQFNSSTTGSQFLTSRYFYDLREQAIILDVGTVNFGNSDEIRLTLNGMSGDNVTLARTRVADDDRLIATRSEVANGTFIVRDIHYDPTMHKVWKIARSQDRVQWFAGPSTTGAFTMLGDVPMAQIDFVQTELHATNGSGLAIQVAINEINGGTPTGSACPIGILQDTFPGTVIDPKWARARVESGCKVTVNDGLTMTPMTNDYGCTVAGAMPVDATSRSIALELTAPPADAQFLFAIDLGETDAIGFVVEGTTISAYTFVPANERGKVTIPPSAIVWLQLENTLDGSTVFQWSDNGTDFHEITRLAGTGPQMAATAMFFNMHGAPATTPVTVKQVR